MLGLPIDAWLLLLFAVGLGLALELAFYLGHRGDGRGRDTTAGPTRQTRDGGRA